MTNPRYLLLVPESPHEFPVIFPNGSEYANGDDDHDPQSEEDEFHEAPVLAYTGREVATLQMLMAAAREAIVINRAILGVE